MTALNPGSTRTTESSGNFPIAGYETTFVAKSEITDEGLNTLKERLAGVVQTFAGEVVLTEDWGKRKLAYPISKETRGHYIYLVYSGKGDVVHEMERNLRLNENILRFLTVNLASEFDADQFRKRRADVHAAAKKREEEREARREERNQEFRRGSYDDDSSDYRE
ncbi:MAG: 30S ribosomal protein S6 [Bdellovibrionota bacterium]